MTRKVPEWIGKTDDTVIPPRVKLRVFDRQGGKCAVTGASFRGKTKPEYDHIIALINGGENRESNIQAICSQAHKGKTKSDVAIKAKTNRVRMKNIGIKSKPSAHSPWKSKFKKKIDGTVVLRNGE